MNHKVPLEITIYDSSLDSIADRIADRVAQRVESRLQSLLGQYREKQEEPVSSSVVFIRMKELKLRLGLSTSSIYKKISEGTFPAPIKLGARTSAWRIDEVERWEAEIGLGQE